MPACMLMRASAKPAILKKRCCQKPGIQGTSTLQNQLMPCRNLQQRLSTFLATGQGKATAAAVVVGSLLVFSQSASGGGAGRGGGSGSGSGESMACHLFNFDSPCQVAHSCAGCRAPSRCNTAGLSYARCRLDASWRSCHAHRYMGLTSTGRPCLCLCAFLSGQQCSDNMVQGGSLQQHAGRLCAADCMTLVW